MQNDSASNLVKLQLIVAHLKFEIHPAKLSDNSDVPASRALIFVTEQPNTRQTVLIFNLCNKMAHLF